MNTLNTVLRRFFFPAILAALLLTALPVTSTATTTTPSDYVGRVSPRTHAHPTPLRIYLVQAEYLPIPGKPSSLPIHNGYFRVTRSNGSVWRLPTCAHEDSDNCVWPARWVGNRRGRSFATINGRTRYFPARMLTVARPRR